MSENTDYLYALKLQRELNGDAADSDAEGNEVSNRNHSAINSNANSKMKFLTQH